MMNFEKFLENYSHQISDEERKELLKAPQGFNSQEEAEHELDYLLNTEYPFGYKNVPDEVDLYRILFLDDSKVDEESLGQHWVMDSDIVDDGFIEKIRQTTDAIGEPVVVRGKFITKDIDWKNTLHNNMSFPREYEVTVGDMQPIDYQIMTLEEFHLMKSQD